MIHVARGILSLFFLGFRGRILKDQLRWTRRLISEVFIISCGWESGALRDIRAPGRPPPGLEKGPGGIKGKKHFCTCVGNIPLIMFPTDINKPQ